MNIGYRDGLEPKFLDELLDEDGMRPEQLCRDTLDVRHDVKIGGDPTIDSGDYMRDCLDGIREARKSSAGRTMSSTTG